MDRLASMETFVRVVETGSFSGAARQLRVGQPAVSKTVAQLEEYLGVKLLTRSTRGLTPTEAGLGYLERAKRALEEAAEAELAARGAGAGLKGRLRVCAAVTFARIHLIPLLPKFLAQNPELELEVVLDDRQIDLVQEGIDVALRMGKMMDSTLTARRIARSRTPAEPSATRISPRSRPPATATRSLSRSVWLSGPPYSPTSSTASTTPRSTSPRSRDATAHPIKSYVKRITTMTTLAYTTQNPLVRPLQKS